jgi:hypothetical protein
MKKKLLFFAVLFSVTAVLIGATLLTGCKKNVGSITNIVKYDVSGFVLLSGSTDPVAGVTIYLDSTSVTTTDITGKYVIPKLMPGTYLIKAVKDGFTKGQFNMTVSTDGFSIKAILLKKLEPAIMIGATGGNITATAPSGSKTASLSISPGVVSTNNQISVTPMASTEVPKVLPATGTQMLGTTVSINASDPTLNFTQGVTLTFNLVAVQKPGDAVNVQYFNEKTNAWEAIQNGTVNAGGLTAGVVLHHFSTYSAAINGAYSETIDKNISSTVVASSSNFAPQYSWQSTLEYRQNITNTIDPVWLYQTVESQSKVNFSTITYGTANSVVKTANNISTISTPPNSNPDMYRAYPNRDWELVKYTNWVKNTVTANVWSITANKYVNTSVSSWYQLSSFVWLWRPDATYAIPAINLLNPPVSYVIVDQHYGGSGH